MKAIVLATTLFATAFGHAEPNAADDGPVKAPEGEAVETLHAQVEAAEAQMEVARARMGGRPGADADCRKTNGGSRANPLSDELQARLPRRADRR